MGVTDGGEAPTPVNMSVLDNDEPVNTAISDVDALTVECIGCRAFYAVIFVSG